MSMLGVRAHSKARMKKQKIKEREGERGENDGAHCSSCMTIISHLQPRHDVLHENVAAGLNGWVMEHHRNAWKKDEDHP